MRDYRSEFFELSRDLVAVITLPGFIIDLNPAWTELLGWSIPEIKARPLQELVHPDDLPRTLAAAREMKELRTQVSRLENRVRHRNGGFRVLEWEGHFSADAQSFFCIGRDVTQTRAQTQALIESESRLQNMIQNVPGAIYQFISRKDGLMSLAYVSPHFASDHPLSRHNLSIPFEELTQRIHPDDRESFIRDIHDAINDRGPWYWEGRIVSPQGREVWFQGQSRPRPLPGGDMIWDGILLDITDRKIVELELKESRERFELAIEGSNSGLTEWDHRTRLITYSRQWRKMLGYGPEELSDGVETWRSLVHPDDLPQLEKAGTRYMTGESRELTFRHRLRRKDGTYAWVLVRTTAIRDKNGLPIRTMGWHIDVTELVEAEQRLTFEESFLRKVIDTSPNLIFIKDVKGRFRLINQALARISGKPANHLDLQDRDYLPEEKALFIEADLQVIREKKTLHLTEPFTLPDGETRWFETIKTPFEDPSGETLVLGISVDVTEKRQIQEKARAQELKLISASKMSTLGEMAGGIAHEINNPLTILHGNASQLLRLSERSGLDPTRIQNIAKKMIQTAERIAHIVRALRSFARDAEEDPFEMISIAKIIEETLDLCQARFSRHDVQVRAPAIPTDWTLECRPVQISQVLLNLLNNAFDAIQNQSDAWIEIALHRNGDPEKPSTLDISVTDSGPGIPKEITDKIMQPFFTTKEVGKGTGLGLSISNSLVRAHGGMLTIDASSPHTRFVVQLPIHQPRA